ncbi:hypothetical protein ACTXT7_007202 [Hymenolepis weldensis]
MSFAIFGLSVLSKGKCYHICANMSPLTNDLLKANKKQQPLKIEETKSRIGRTCVGQFGMNQRGEKELRVGGGGRWKL